MFISLVRICHHNDSEDKVDGDLTLCQAICMFLWKTELSAIRANNLKVQTLNNNVLIINEKGDV